MKIAFKPPTTTTADAPPRVSRAERETATFIAELVRRAPDGAAAWGRLMVGVEIERNGDGLDVLVPILMSPERTAANDAAMAIDHKIARGWLALGQLSTGYPRSWLERLCELHAESLDKLAVLDGVRRREAEAAGKPFASEAACWLSRASVDVGAYLRGVTPGPQVKRALERLGRAIDAGDPEAVAMWAKRYVAAAVFQRFGDKVVEDE